MLLTMKEILDKANEGNYAVAAPNVMTELDARAALEAAEELNAPLILDVAPGHPVDIVFFGKYLAELAGQAKVPVAINLDHGGTISQVVSAIRAGFTSVMIDKSVFPYDENVSEVKKVVEIAHSIGISVEAEIGHVGQGMSYDVDRNAGLTDPEEAKRFVEDTGVDCIAVAIGTAHGAYDGTPYIDFERLAEIKTAVKLPLVLHGGSGSGDENLRKVCSMGINKVNVCNDLMKTACTRLKEADTEGNGAYLGFTIMREGYKARLMELIEIFGGKDKAWPVSSRGLGRSVFLAEVEQH